MVAINERTFKIISWIAYIFDKGIMERILKKKGNHK